MEMGYTAKNSKDSIVFSKTEILKSLGEQKCTKSRKKRIATIQMESYEIPPKLDCRPSDDCNNVLKALLGKENASAYEMDISEVVRPLPKIQPKAKIHRPKVVTKGVPDNNDVVGKIMEIMDTSSTNAAYLSQSCPEDPCSPEKNIQNKFSRHNLTVKNTKTGNASINAFVTKASNKRTIELHKTRRNISFAGKHMFSPVNIKNVKSIKRRERYNKIACIKCNHYYASVKSLICSNCKKNEKDKPLLKKMQKQLVLLQRNKRVPKQRAHINKAENKALLKSIKMKYEVTNVSSSMSRLNKHSQSKSQKTKSMSYISERMGSKKQRTLRKLHKSWKKSEEKRVFSHEAQDDCSVGNLDSNKSGSLYNFSKTKGHCDDSVHHINPDHIVSYTLDDENELISFPICSEKNTLSLTNVKKNYETSDKIFILSDSNSVSVHDHFEHRNDSAKNFSSYRECNNNFSDPCKKLNLVEKTKENTVKEYRRSGQLKIKTDSQQKIHKSIVSVSVNERKVKKDACKVSTAVEKVAMKQNREVKPKDQADCLIPADHPCNGLDSKKLNLKDTYFSQYLHKKIGSVRNVVNDDSQKPVLQTVNKKNIPNPIVPERYEKVTVDLPVHNSCRESTAPCVFTAQKSSFKEQSCKKSMVSYVPIGMAESEMHEETTMLELPSGKISGLEHNISQLETVVSNEVQESKLLLPKKVILKHETEDYKINKSETFLGHKGNFAYHLSFNGMTMTCLDRNKDIDDFMLLPDNKESVNSNEIEVISLCDDSSDENFDGKEMENGTIPDSVDLSCTKDLDTILEGTNVINEIRQCAFDSSNHMDETLNIKISNVCSVSEFIEPNSLSSEDSCLIISEINTKTSALDGKYTSDNSNVCSALDLAINEIVEYSVLSIMDLDYGIGNDVSSVKETYEKTKAELLKHIKDDAILSKEQVQ